MNKKPILITCQPDDQYFIFQNHAYIESCIQAGFDEERIHILLYVPKERTYNQNWEKLKTIYPKLNIFVYQDKGISKYLGLYIPVLRPHILWQHFEKFPELKDEVIIYTDCDILWTRKPDIEKFYDDDKCYVSDAKSYLNYEYFNRKNNDILPEKKEFAKHRDFLGELCGIVGIDKELTIVNNDNTGGVQYILKGVDANFWKKVERDVIAIRITLLQINRQFYKDENAGLQSWCSDLFAVLWNLWYIGKEVKVIPELNFSWATDAISRIDQCSIFHNAGIASEFQDGHPCFYKGKYHQGNDPFKDFLIDDVISNPESAKFCTWWYAKKLKELFLKYKLQYNN